MIDRFSRAIRVAFCRRIRTSRGLGLSAGQLAATVRLEPAAVRAPDQPLLAAIPYEHGTRHEGLALILVGVAGIVTGLAIDEPVVTIAGAGVGGVGLYFYLR